MRWNGRWMLLTSLGGASSAWAEPPPEQGAEVSAVVPSHGPELLGKLKGQSLTLVPLEGAEPSPVTQQHCAWSVVVIGSRGEDGAWAQIERVYYPERPVRFDTPLGRMELSWRVLRPHLRTTWEQTLITEADLAETMDPELRESLITRISAGGDPITLSESCLIAGKAIAAQVDVEGYLLPPEPPDFQPGEGSQTVLRLSDGAWTDGYPELPLTPPFDDWSY